MREFLNRPYRDRKVREQRKHAAAEYHKKLSRVVAKRNEDRAARRLLVPPELVNIAEESLAGISTDNTEDADAGATPKS